MKVNPIAPPKPATAPAIKHTYGEKRLVLITNYEIPKQAAVLNPLVKYTLFKNY